MRSYNAPLLLCATSVVIILPVATLVYFVYYYFPLHSLFLTVFPERIWNIPFRVSDWNKMLAFSFHKTVTKAAFPDKITPFRSYLKLEIKVLVNNYRRLILEADCTRTSNCKGRCRLPETFSPLKSYECRLNTNKICLLRHKATRANTLEW